MAENQEKPDTTGWTKEDWESYLSNLGMDNNVGYEDDPNRVTGFTLGVKGPEDEDREDSGRWHSPESCPISLGVQVDDSQNRIYQPNERPVEDLVLEEPEEEEP